MSGLVGEAPQHENNFYVVLSRILGAVVMILLSLLGWLGVRIIGQVDSIQQRVAALETHQAVSTVMSHEVDRKLMEMNRKLDRLLERPPQK